MLSDFIYKKMISSNVFETGLMMGQSVEIPDYIIELNITDFSSYKIDKDREVRFKLYFNLFKRNSSEREIVLSKEIKTNYPIDGNKVEDIPPAMSQAISKACSELLISLQNTID